MIYKYLLVQIHSSDLFFWLGFIYCVNFLKKSLMAPFYGWDSTVSRLQSHYEEIVYFLPLSFQKFLVLIRSISKGWKDEMTLKPSSGFELVYQPSYYQI